MKTDITSYIKFDSIFQNEQLSRVYMESKEYEKIYPRGYKLLDEFIINGFSIEHENCIDKFYPNNNTIYSILIGGKLIKVQLEDAYVSECLKMIYIFSNLNNNFYLTYRNLYTKDVYEGNRRYLNPDTLYRDNIRLLKDEVSEPIYKYIEENELRKHAGNVDINLHGNKILLEDFF